MRRLARHVGGLVLATALSACHKPAPEVPLEKIPGAHILGDTIVFAKESPQLAAIRVVAAEPERLSLLRINGRIVWDETRTARVNSPLAGRIVSLHSEPGKEVRKGDTLAVISSPDYGQAQAEARRAQTALKQSEQVLSRNMELHAAGVIALKELQAAETEHAQSRAELERTMARAWSYGDVGKIDQQFRLRAPIDGVVVTRRANIGQEVRPDQGSEEAMFVISDPTRLWVNLDIPEAMTTIVAVGENLRISAPALPGEAFSARVQYVSDFVDPNSRMVRARASLDNWARRLKSEMYVAADVEVPPSSTLRVPSTGVFLLESRHYVFAEESAGRYVRRQVLAEEGSLGFMRIVEGLHAGDKVVADGALLLQQMLNQNATSTQDQQTNEKSAK
jgi:cobalt-zinc-cadmium efflux system membrane fusion protein